MITQKDWGRRIKLLLRLAPEIAKIDSSPLSPRETKEYNTFIEASMDLVDEHIQPEDIPTDRDKAREHIRFVLTHSIKAHSLRRLFVTLAPETAYLAASTIARMGTDKQYWRAE